MNEIIGIILTFGIIVLVVYVGIDTLKIQGEEFKEFCDEKYGIGKWVVYQDICPSSLASCYYCKLNVSEEFQKVR